MNQMQLNSNSVQSFQLHGSKPPPMPNNVLTRSQARARIQEKLVSIENKEEEEEKDLDYDPNEDMS